MRIGIDFDNTLVDYGALFHRAACAAGLIPPETPADKAAVKARIMHHGGGNQAWTELQGVVYGDAIRDARPFPGVHEFLDFCAGHRLAVSVVSHK